MPYQLEYKRTVDSTWTVFSSTLTAAQFPATIPGLIAGTQYDVRCLARDVSGNVSAYSATSQATTQGTIVWSTVPTQTFTQGIAATKDISQYDASGATDTITKAAGTALAGISYDQANKRIVYDGVGVVAAANDWQLLADNAASSGDWATRSTAAGIMVANRLNSSSDITPNILLNGTEGHVSFDSTLAPTGGSGSLKFSVLNSDVADSGNVFVQFPDQGNGSTIWASYRRRAPAEHEFAMWPTTDGPSSRGAKWSILSHRAGSNQPYECVVQNDNMRGNISGYHQDGNSFPPVDVAFASACSSGDFRQVPSIDYSVTSALTGTDPDTGAAWSACQQDRHRYGGLYNVQQGTTPDFGWGLGDPLDGAFRAYPNEWITVTQRVIVGTFGTASSRWTCWAARDGQPYVKLWDLSNITLGAGGNLVFNTLWLLPYATNRVAGGRKISSRTTNITGVTMLGVAPNTPVGTGTLAYNSATGRFTWAGAGQSAGTARGYSAANGKLRLNLFASGSNSSSFDQLAIEINPAALPSSSQSDTVTIANGRPDTQVNYAEAIISSQAINAPGGFAPT